MSRDLMRVIDERGLQSQVKAPGEQPFTPASNVTGGLALLYVASVPFEAVRLVEGRSASSLLGMLLVLSVLADLISGRRIAPLPKRFNVAAYMFILWVTASYFWSIDQSSSVTRITTMGSLLLSTIALAYALPQIASSAALVYIGASWVLALSILMQPASSLDGRRTAFGNENDVATLLVVAIALTLFGTSRPTVARRAVAIVGLPILTTGSIATGSRSATIALVAMAIAYPLWAVRTSHFKGALKAISFVCCAAFLVALMPQQYMPERLRNTEELVIAGEFTSRETFWAAFFDRGISPFGVGSGASKAFMLEQVGLPAVTHNLWIGMTLEYGLLGLSLFLALWIFALQSVRQSSFRAAIPIAIVGLIPMSLTLSLETQRVMWLVLALILTRHTRNDLPERPSHE